ncbi:hypothetical protein D3C85_107960 [compost metagenome]
MNPRASFQITKLLFCPTGTYGDQFLRPFYLGDNVDFQSMSILQEVTKGGRNINAGVLAPFSGQLLRPKADVMTGIQIANGWGEQRLRFMMEVQSQAMGANLISYVTGYTDYPGYSRINGNEVVFDKNMKLYFNNTVTLQHSTYDAGHGNATRSSVIDSSHLLFGKYNPSFNADQSEVAMTTRPEDIFSIMEVSMQSGNQPYSDGRLLFADLLPKKSRRSNELTNVYMSSILSNYRDSVTNAMGAMNGPAEAMSYAIGNVAESVINEDPLFHAICRTLNFNEDGSITYGSLCQVSPGLDHVAAVTGGESKYTQQLHHAGQTANLAAATPECMAATTVAREVPAIMSELMLIGLMFTATNDTIGGEYVVDIAPNYLSFAQMDMTRYIEMFKQRFIGSVLQGLSNNRMTKFSMSVQVDMFGETYVNISLNGGPMTPHCFTGFADALTAPVMSYNQEAVFSLVKDFDQVANNLDIKHAVAQGVAQHHQHAQSNNLIVPPAGGNIHNPWEGQL